MTEPYPDPQDPLEPYGKIYKDDIGVLMGVYRGSNSLDSPRGLGMDYDAPWDLAWTLDP